MEMLICTEINSKTTTGNPILHGTLSSTIYKLYILMTMLFSFAGETAAINNWTILTDPSGASKLATSQFEEAYSSAY
jgi:hypothetical protein